MEKADQVRLNHELLIWRGFTLSNSVWSYPDGVTVDNGVPYFPEDETACFRWLTPRLWICSITLVDAVFWSVYVSIPDLHGCGKHGNGKALEETLALAFCLAIQKLIRSK